MADIDLIGALGAAVERARAERGFRTAADRPIHHEDWCHTVTGCTEPSHCTCDYAARGMIQSTAPDGSAER